jgi:ribosomal protein L17
MQEAERHKKITDHISSHLGCLTEDLCKAMEEHMARSTFFKDLAKLKEDKIVREEHTNKRDHKLFVDSDNPLIFIPNQLEEIEKTFKTLLDKSKPHWEDISEQRLNALKESNIDLIRELFFKGTKSLVYFVPTMILQMITDSITIHARTIWLNKIADKDIINKLFANVFMKLASLNSDYVDYLNK